MIILKHHGDTLTCANAIKGSNWIRVFDENGNRIVTFEGVSNFSEYVLIDESGNPIVFSEPESDDDKMDVAIRAVVTALGQSGNIVPTSAEGVIGRALEIAHKQIQ